GLEVLMTPIWSDGNGMTGWTRDCKIASDTALRQACEDVFRFDNN
ncbi:prepilin peptidase-dependent pilin, partial [Enterobacter hormaechei]|nr:prepilin peptidase-dependent pilin [Enterobacter hormaechei]MBF9272925.1 prepilin peptidase-dependent pilin [Enterobacter hormaechei]